MFDEARPLLEPHGQVVYLDNNASTRVDDRVLEAIVRVYRSGAANSSSSHLPGKRANAWVGEARERVANLLQCRPQEIVFTSGATEADNLAIKGVALNDGIQRRHVVTCATEHAAVLEPARFVERLGWRVSIVPVHVSGQIDLESLQQTLSSSDTALVSVMAVNNETGVIMPVAQIAEQAHRAGALYHCDATQLLTWGSINVEELGVDMLSLSGHKIHGPQGVGALYISRRLREQLTPILSGGGHEQGVRSGTVNIAGCVGLGVAAELAASDGAAAAPRVAKLRDEFEHVLQRALGNVAINGATASRAPGTANVRFAAAEAEAIIAAMPDIAVSTGSACTSSAPHPSHVLTAMGLTEEEANRSLRVSLSRETTAAQMELATRRIIEAVLSVTERWATVRKIGAST
jgi:cysteine desulfurase